MPFKNYSELADPLRLPIGGKVYTLPELSIQDGTRLAEILAATADPAAKIDAPDVLDAELRHLLLGDVYDEMTADGVSAAALGRSIMTALADFQRGRAVAEIVWETGGDPLAITRITEKAKTAARRPQDHKTKAA